LKPLIVLLGTFFITLLAIYAINLDWEFKTAGNIAMSVMLLFTAIGHFVLKESMAKMLPSSIPFRSQIVLATGFLEILGAVGLIIVATRTLTAWMLLIFFILILPANIYAAIHKVNHENAKTDGPGVKYLWFRIPLQLFFILWIAFFGL
jgi:uncharacterized membrane protein